MTDDSQQTSTGPLGGPVINREVTLTVVDGGLCVQFIQSSGCASVIRALEPVLSVRAKDELATVLVSVLQSIDAARNFLVDIVMDEVKNEGRYHLSCLS